MDEPPKDATWNELKCAFYRAVDSRPAELIEYLLGLQKRIETLEQPNKHSETVMPPQTEECLNNFANFSGGGIGIQSKTCDN